MGSVRVAIVGAGNCASSLVQGVEYYKDADPEARVPGLMHVEFGSYHVRDIEFVAAFDVDAKKVGQDLADAIGAGRTASRRVGGGTRKHRVVWGWAGARGGGGGGGAPPGAAWGEYYQEMIT